MTINEILNKYTNGEMTLEEANAKLKELKSKVYLDIEKNVIHDDETDTYGLMDSGTGTLDKVEIKNGKLINSVGTMKVIVFFKGETYRIGKDGVTLI